MAVTVLVTHATSVLPAGVATGVLLSGIFFAFSHAAVNVQSEYNETTKSRTIVYRGDIFRQRREFADCFDLQDHAQARAYRSQRCASLGHYRRRCIGKCGGKTKTAVKSKSGSPG